MTKSSKTISMTEAKSFLPKEEIIKSRAKELKGGFQTDLEIILNFDDYYKGKKIIVGKNGPEKINTKVFISIYHFLEVNGKDPKNFDVLAAGADLTSVCRSYKENYEICEYEGDGYEIHKYEYFFIIKNFSIIEKFKLK